MMRARELLRTASGAPLEVETGPLLGARSQPSPEVWAHRAGGGLHAEDPGRQLPCRQQWRRQQQQNAMSGLCMCVHCALRRVAAKQEPLRYHRHPPSTPHAPAPREFPHPPNAMHQAFSTQRLARVKTLR